MRDFHANLPPTSTVYVGIDLHRRRWHVTARTAEAELFSASIEGTWEALRHVLDRFCEHHVEAVYEAGYFGYWLHDRLAEYGASCTVTPPSLIPQEAGNRVKTDRLDSRKLARLLSKGMLKRVWVPTPQEREHRQVIRRRRQLIRDRLRTQNRVKRHRRGGEEAALTHEEDAARRAGVRPRLRGLAEIRDRRDREVGARRYHKCERLSCRRVK